MDYPPERPNGSVIQAPGLASITLVKTEALSRKRASMNGDVCAMLSHASQPLPIATIPSPDDRRPPDEGTTLPPH